MIIIFVLTAFNKIEKHVKILDMMSLNCKRSHLITLSCEEYT